MFRGTHWPSESVGLRTEQDLRLSTADTWILWPAAVFICFV